MNPEASLGVGSIAEDSSEEKIRRQKRKRSRRAKEKILEAKRKRKEKKSNRSYKPGFDEYI